MFIWDSNWPGYPKSVQMMAENQEVKTARAIKSAFFRLTLPTKQIVANRFNDKKHWVKFPVKWSSWLRSTLFKVWYLEYKVQKVKTGLISYWNSQKEDFLFWNWNKFSWEENSGKLTQRPLEQAKRIPKSKSKYSKTILKLKR